MLALPVPVGQSANGRWGEGQGGAPARAQTQLSGLQWAERRASLPMPQTHSNNGAVPVSTPPLKPLGLMQMLAPLLAVLLAVVVALLAAWALSLPAPAQGVTAIQADRHMLYEMGNSGFCPGCELPPHIGNRRRPVSPVSRLRT